MEDLPLEDAFTRRIPQADFGHQRFQLLNVFRGNRFLDEHPAVGLAMLSTIMINREVGANNTISNLPCVR